MTKDIIQDMSDHMVKTIDALRREYSKIRTGRATTSLLDDIRVDFYGTPSPLSSVATLSVPEARTITLSPWEPKMIAPIEKAILNSNIGLTPSNDGRIIRLILPSLTEERRKDIVKDLKRKAEDDRIALRNIRRDAIEKLKKLEKDKKITEDELKRAEKEVQDLTDKHVAKVDEVLAHKEKEVMEV
ncbi:MAG: ribosome recycling factor [Geobacteraceae bacterium]|nr:ribosome recycling factor [Geobacteraceae bacterium]